MGRWPGLVPNAERGDLQGLPRPIKAWREEIGDLGKPNQPNHPHVSVSGFKRKMEFQVKVIHID